MKYVALLRGINVGGHKKILMKDLRALLSKSKYLQNIETYIQSGNVIFESSSENVERLESEIYNYIYKEYNFEVPVQVYSQENWSLLVEDNPYLDKNIEHINRLYGTFLDKYPSEQNICKLNELDFYPDSLIIKKNVIYTYYDNGVGRSKMTSAIFENKLKVSTTSRNWKTICKIQELLSN